MRKKVANFIIKRWKILNTENLTPSMNTEHSIIYCYASERERFESYNAKSNSNSDMLLKTSGCLLEKESPCCISPITHLKKGKGKTGTMLSRMPKE
jgi:hypothetical protein